MNNILSRSSIFLGRCVTSDMASVVRVCINTFEIDERFLMYFENRNYIYATDPKEQCQPGDWVLIKEATHKDKRITHIVDKLIYKMGYSVDPLTGKKCAGREFTDDIIRTSALFGQKPPFLQSQPETNKKEEKS